MTRLGEAGPAARLGSGPAGAALLLVLGLVTWLPAIHGGMVNLDTPWLVRDNPILSTGDPRWIPTLLFDLDPGIRRTLGAEYLPVRDLTVLVDFALFGRRWALHHAVNLAWYLAGCLLFWRIARRLLAPRSLLAFLVAALFTVHPVHVESVVWLASRKDVVSLTFFMAAVWAWLAIRRRGRAVAVALLFTVLATWSKNTAVVLPGVLAAVSWLHRGEDARRPRFWLQWLPFAAFVLLAWNVSNRVGADMGMYAWVRGGSLPAALLLECRVVLRYLSMLVWPVGLSVVYPEPEVLPLADPRALGALAAVMAMGIGLLLLARRMPLATLGGAWAFLTLLPVSQVVPIQNLMADRYLLLPSAGFLLVVGAGLAGAGSWRPRSRIWPGILPVAGAVAVLLLALLTARRCRDWHDTVTLWSAAVAQYPTSVRARASLAGALLGEGRVQEAERTLVQALGEQGGHAALLQGLGWVWMVQDRPHRAERALRRALERDPRRRKAANNLIKLLLDQDRPREALAVAQQLLRYRPLYPQGWNALGAVLLELGDPEEAASASRRAVTLDPHLAAAWCNLGGAGWLQGNRDLAEGAWRRCLALDPQRKQARRGLRALGAIRTDASAGAPLKLSLIHI